MQGIGRRLPHSSAFTIDWLFRCRCRRAGCQSAPRPRTSATSSPKWRGSAQGKHCGLPFVDGATALGARIEIAQTGAGQIIVSGSGVTLRLPAGKQAKTRLQNSIIALTKRGTDDWILSGDLA